MSRMRLRPTRFSIVTAVGVLAVLCVACSSSPTSGPAAVTTLPSTGPSGAGSTTTQPAISNCTTAQLAVTAGMSSGAAGTISQVVLFQNISTKTCLLHAFPGVAGLDAGGNQITQATRVVGGAPFTGSPASLPTVQLTAGSSASALVQGSDVPTGAATSCVTYAALLVTPPNAVQSVHVPASLPGCSGLRVGPVYADTTGTPA